MTVVDPRFVISVPAVSGVLRLSGELDMETASSLVAEGEMLVLTGQSNVVLDCATLTFCDSHGLRAMLSLAERVRPDGSVTIANPSSMLRRMLEITGLIDHFELVESNG